MVYKAGGSRQYHGGSKTPTYRSWISMISRCCHEKDPAYKYYGGRGIKICENWFEFKNFIADMGERPIGTTIDRKNSDLNYEKNNCQWVSRKEQTRNRKATKMTLDLAIVLVRMKSDGIRTPIIASHFKIAERTVQNIVSGKRWPEALQKVLEQLN